jgi:hypothetical protein
MKALAAIVTLVAFSTTAFAEGVYQNADELQLVQSISIRVSDRVVDGCLPNPNALKTEAGLVLQQSGIKITDEPSERDHRLLIAAAGREIRLPGGQVGLCIATLDVNMARFIQAPEGHAAAIWAYKLGALVGGASKTESQENIRAAVSQIVGDLASEILKARGQ